MAALAAVLSLARVEPAQAQSSQSESGEHTFGFNDCFDGYLQPGYGRDRTLLEAKLGTGAPRNPDGAFVFGNPYAAQLQRQLAAARPSGLAIGWIFEDATHKAVVDLVLATQQSARGWVYTRHVP